MNFNRTIFLASATLTLLPYFAQAQESDKVRIAGSVQSDVLIPQTDNTIKAGKNNGDFETNTYIDLNLFQKYVDAGIRYEYLEHPLPGFENDFKGNGVPYVFVKGKLKRVELTAGSFYEQFGNGLILRTYEERSLGIDNSLMGGRLITEPIDGMRIKLLGGWQRRYWKLNKAFVAGGDMELTISNWIKPLAEKNWNIMLGTSYVNKHEKDQDITVDVDPTKKLNLPLNVGAYDVRTQIQHGDYNFIAEYAQKNNDPSSDNKWIYKKGNVLFLSGSYSTRGRSILIQAKRSDNMSFRSRRDMQGISSTLNFLPAFTNQHTYALATIYPYATQTMGEWAFQTEVGYNFKRHSALGGKYGTNLKVNYSHIRSIDKKYEYKELNGGQTLMGADGYSSSFFKMGNEIYYQDVDVSIEKKLSPNFKLSGMYVFQYYNPIVVSHAEPNVKANIFILEGKYEFNPTLTLRGEVQYMSTNKYRGSMDTEPIERSNQGDWMFGLLELSIQPSWMITVSDMYNSGATNIHYYLGSVTWSHKAHRLQVGYGRTRAGYNCSGGVCRMVPASKGVQMSYNYSF
jgi:hypothetical protein